MQKLINEWIEAIKKYNGHCDITVTSYNDNEICWHSGDGSYGGFVSTRSSITEAIKKFNLALEKRELFNKVRSKRFNTRSDAIAAYLEINEMQYIEDRSTPEFMVYHMETTFLLDKKSYNFKFYEDGRVRFFVR